MFSFRSLFFQGLVLITAAILAIAIASSRCRGHAPKAELILTNGSIHTMNPEQPFAEAIAIKDHRILCIGTKQQVSFFQGNHTTMIDLRGDFVCPGFNDAHTNILGAASKESPVDLSGTTSTRDIRTCVMPAIRDVVTNNPGGWILGAGWDQTLFPDREWPDRSLLDLVAPDVPIFLVRVCGHVALANQCALRIAGIDADTPDPLGGEIVKDPKTGQPTGLLKETAMDLVTQYIPKPSQDDYENALKLFLEKAGRLGITSIQDQSPILSHHVLEQFLAEERLTCRVSLGFPLSDELEAAKKSRSKYTGDMLRFGMLHGTVDGSLGGRTAALIAPYDDDPGVNGLTRMSQNDLNLLVLEADREGFQIGLHADGDRAVRMSLDAFELAGRLNPDHPRRHRIEHAQVVSPQDQPRYCHLNVTASIQPVHCIENMRWLEYRLGTQRCMSASAWQSLNKYHVPLAFGSDYPISPLNPMLVLYAAVTRKDTLGYPPKGWFPQECLSLEEALAAYTTGSACAEGTDNVKGSLEPGKFADLVVLDHHLFKISPREFLDTKVKMTILGGAIVYQEEKP